MSVWYHGVVLLVFTGLVRFMEDECVMVSKKGYIKILLLLFISATIATALPKHRLEQNSKMMMLRNSISLEDQEVCNVLIKKKKKKIETNRIMDCESEVMLYHTFYIASIKTNEWA